MIEDFDITNNFYRTIADGKSLKLHGSPTGSIKIYDDPVNEYEVNSYGYRGKEFSSTNDFIFAGCSFTYGLGVPEETVWGNIVANKLSLSSSAPVAKPGASISWIVERLFAYFSEFGHPKYLLCLMPSAHRFVVPIDGLVLKGHPLEGEPGTFGEGGQKIYNGQVLTNKEILETRYIQRPYSVRKIYTNEVTLYESVRALRMLEQYCKTAGINLLWSTWDKGLSMYLNKINADKDLRFKDYFRLNLIADKRKLSSGYKYFLYEGEYDDYDNKYYECIVNHWNVDCSCAMNCHRNLLDIYGQENFYLGSDTGRGQEYAHPSIHVQAHYAERFIEELMLRYPHDFK